jgi:hypothetical protein
VQGARRSAILAPMTLEQLSFLAQIVGAVGVLASLIFVGLQIRQNTQSQHVVAVESLAAAIAAINVPAMESPLLGTALAKALKDWGAASHDERVGRALFPLLLLQAARAGLVSARVAGARPRAVDRVGEFDSRVLS